MYSNKTKIFFRIGAEDIQDKKYGFKAKGLDLAAKNKICVPSGYLLLHEILKEFESKSLGMNDLISKIQELPIKNNFSIRSAFSIEDQKEKYQHG